MMSNTTPQPQGHPNRPTHGASHCDHTHKPWSHQPLEMHATTQLLPLWWNNHGELLTLISSTVDTPLKVLRQQTGCSPVDDYCTRSQLLSAQLLPQVPSPFMPLYKLGPDSKW